MRCRASSQGGQGVAIDFLFAGLIFLLLLNAGLGIWGSNASFFEKQALLNELHSEAAQAADLLVRHTGTPDDWESAGIDEIAVIGLAKRDRVLDEEKVSRFVQLAQTLWSSDYNKARIKLLVGRDFYFRLSNENGETIAETAQPNLPEIWAINVRRIVKFGGEAAIAEFTLYFPK